MRLCSNRMLGERGLAKLGFSGDGGRNGVSETVVVRLSVEMMFLGIAFAVLTRIIGEGVDGDYVGSCNVRIEDLRENRS